MKLLLIRHAKAEDRTLFTLSDKKDALRALTPNGRKTMRQVAKGLRKHAPDIDVLATSPLLRARQTADIVAKVFGVAEAVEVTVLLPGAKGEELLDWLRAHAADAVVALVGHEPDLSELAGWLLTGKRQSVITLKKGAACLLEFPDKPAPGRGVLAWLLAPAQLRRLGK
jgi:phosphohistidine phosphatase